MPTAGTQHVVAKGHKNTRVDLRKQKAHTYGPSHIYTHAYIIAKRMTRFVINNGYVNKAGVPGFPGCIEHTTMLWDRMKTAKNNKTELHVIWLDLENASGSVRHQLLEKAMEFFWIPEDIKNLISTNFKRTYVRFSNNKYSSNWQKLNIGILMGCVISPLLLVWRWYYEVPMSIPIK